MANVTINVLETRVRQRADVENDTHVAQSEIFTALNDAYCTLRDILIEADRFYGISRTFSTTANQLQYVLNSAGVLASDNFYKMLGLYVIESGSSGTAEKRPLRLISDCDLQSYRAVDAAHSMEIQYVPLHTDATTGQTFDGINGFEELMVILAAIDIKEKRGENPRFLIEKRDNQIRRITKAAKLNLYEPKVIKRVYNRQHDPLKLFRNTVHAYRIVGAQGDGVNDSVGPSVEIYRHVGYLVV